MKLTPFLSTFCRRIGKTLTVSSLLLSVVSSFSVSSAIRIIGPPDDTPPLSSAEPLSQAVTSTIRQTVGPTRKLDTLWSIASGYKPNNSVTVYQTLGAIFRLNPSAFEEANIHGLIPNSRLVMPTLVEIRREKTDDVAQRLQIDQVSKDQQTVNREPLSKQVPKAVKSTVVSSTSTLSTTTRKVAMPFPAKTKVATAESMPSEKKTGVGEVNALKTPLKPDMSGVQKQINQSDMQMGKLVESNHILKIRLAEVQNELSDLKEQMTKDKKLTGEIREFLEHQRVNESLMQTKERSMFETLISSPWMLAVGAIIPALLIIGTVVFVTMRRRKDDNVEEPEGLDGESIKDMPVIIAPELDDDTDELMLEDDELEVTDETDAEDLFGDEILFDSNSNLDDINFSDDPETSEGLGKELDGSTDVGIDTDLTNGLDDAVDIKSDLDVEASSKGAIGLEDMERALDEMASSEERELSPDELLAEMWEKSLREDEGGGTEVDDIDALLNAEQSLSPEVEKPKETETIQPQDINELDESNDALFSKVLEDEPEVDLSQDIDLSDDDTDLLEDGIANANEPTNVDNIFNETDALLDELLDDELLDEDGNVIQTVEKEESEDSHFFITTEDTDLSNTDALLDEILNESDVNLSDKAVLLDESTDEDDLLRSVISETLEEDIEPRETDALLDDLISDENALSRDDTGNLSHDENITLDNKSDVDNKPDVEVKASQSDMDLLDKVLDQSVSEHNKNVIDDLSGDVTVDLLNEETDRDESETTQDDMSLLDALLDDIEIEQTDKLLDVLVDETDARSETGTSVEPSMFDLSSLPEYTEEDAAQEFAVSDQSSVENEQSNIHASSLIEQALSGRKVDHSQIESVNVVETDSEFTDDADKFEHMATTEFVATESQPLAFSPVDTISIDDLGEFDESDALDAALEEQRELDEAVPVSERSVFSQASSLTKKVTSERESLPFEDLSELDDDAYQVAGLNMDALLSEPCDGESFGLGNVENQNWNMSEDESDLAEDESDIPEDESDIWRAEQTPEPELESEDWSDQPEVRGDDIKSMDLNEDLEDLQGYAESELVEEFSSADTYISIEALMEDDGVLQEDPDSVPMNLNVGLEDFPDVLSGIQPADVDSNGELAINMDLAKAYLEMNDIDGALQLLDKVMQGNNSDLKDEARQIIENLK